MSATTTTAYLAFESNFDEIDRSVMGTATTATEYRADRKEINKKINAQDGMHARACYLAVEAGRSYERVAFLASMGNGGRIPSIDTVKLAVLIGSIMETERDFSNYALVKTAYGRVARHSASEATRIIVAAQKYEPTATRHRSHEALESLNAAFAVLDNHVKEVAQQEQDAVVDLIHGLTDDPEQQGLLLRAVLKKKR